MRKSFQKYSSIRFSRFSRKGYAIFCSLHKPISIGHLANFICDKELLKSNSKNKLVSNYSLFSKKEDATDKFSSDLPPIENIINLLFNLQISIFGGKKTGYGNPLFIVTKTSKSCCSNFVLLQQLFCI